jgi:hypothetical protein
MSTQPKALTTVEVAARVAKAIGGTYSRQAVAMAIARGTLPATRIGPIWLVDAADCDAYAEAIKAKNVAGAVLAKRATKAKRREARARRT